MRAPREASVWDLLVALAAEPGISIEEDWFTNRVVVKVRGMDFAVVADGEVALKLPESLSARLVQDRTARSADQTLGKPWVVVPPGDAASWLELAREAYRSASRKGAR